MDTDLLLIIGLVLLAFAVPAVMRAYSNGQPPRAAGLSVLLAGGLILYAVTANPGGYRVAEIPDVFFGVIGRYLN
ncbi:hypothetical protein [Primorskyibacter sp. S87]|uniref:hypothetical protein n=1 Tax=Primorskyibacter sp. S87 TaxID=3415126 RepID=UPI003C7A626F